MGNRVHIWLVKIYSKWFGVCKWKILRKKWNGDERQWGRENILK